MTTTVQINKPTLQFGSQGEVVKELQALINSFLNEPRLTVDGIFNSVTEVTVKEIQERFFLVVDGIVGPKTWAALTTRRNAELPVLRIGSQGDLVRRVQDRLSIHGYALGAIDGAFGPKTEAAVKRFQVDHYLKADGVIGEQTWMELSYLFPYVGC